MARNGMLRHGPCPFVEEGDGRCSCRMTKQTLDQAFDICLGGRHFTCQTYHTISWERQANADNADESQTQLQPGTPAPLNQPSPGSRPHHQPAAAKTARQPKPDQDKQAVA